MQRISGKDLMLITAPIALFGIGLRAASRPNNKELGKSGISYEVRSPTPLEISQGAQVGITVRSLLLSTPNLCPTLDLSLFEVVGKQNNFKSRAITAKVSSSEQVSSKKNFENQQIYVVTEKGFGFNWTETAKWKEPLSAEVRWRSACGGFPPRIERFKLDTNGLMPPDAKAARKADFRVVKATLQYPPSEGARKDPLYISLAIDTSSKQGHPLVTKAQVVGKWAWHNNAGEQTTSTSIQSTQWVPGPQNLSVVILRLWPYSWNSPPLSGDELHGSISVNNGWPQEVTIPWPAKNKIGPRKTEMKFATKLAPLPRE